MSTEFLSIKKLYNKFVQYPFVCTDTRNIIPDCLFFCLKGEKFDGNKFVNEALEKGAKYVITDVCETSRFNRNEGVIFVSNVLTTLQQLANYHRKQLKIPVIGITGSNGKTTTKELVASVLSKKFKIAFTQGNLNNHIGVPLTLLSTKNEDEIAVIEMGANHPGEIEELCQIARPDYGLITNIGEAHLEGFGSLEKIIETKTALYRAAQILFVNSEDEVLKQEALKPFDSIDGAESRATTVSTSLSTSSLSNQKREAELYYYGKNSGTSAEVIESNPYLVIRLFSKIIPTQLTGTYNLPNILGAAAVGKYFGVSIQDICDAISEYTPQNNRSQIVKTGTNTIIADCYNANPTSMKAALENFLQIDAPNKMAILGDMLELGSNCKEEHEKIIDFCKENCIDAVFIGTEFFSLKNEHYPFFENVENCNNYLVTTSIQNNLILLKGSRGIQLENIILKTKNKK